MPLGLRALDLVPPEPDAAERGTVPARHHGPFLKGLPDLPEAPELMAARLLEITDRVLDEGCRGLCPAVLAGAGSWRGAAPDDG